MQNGAYGVFLLQLLQHLYLLILSSRQFILIDFSPVYRFIFLLFCMPGYGLNFVPQKDMLKSSPLVPQDVTLLRNRVGCCRCSQLRSQCRDTERTPCNDRGRDQSNMTTSQGTARIVSHHQKLGGSKEGVYAESQREDSLDHTLISYLRLRSCE